MTRFDVFVVIEAQVLETEELASQLSLSLSLIQGTVLNHEPSKLYLGRRCSLEVRNEPTGGCSIEGANTVIDSTGSSARLSTSFCPIRLCEREIEIIEWNTPSDIHHSGHSPMHPGRLVVSTPFF